MENRQNFNFKTGEIILFTFHSLEIIGEVVEFDRGLGWAILKDPRIIEFDLPTKKLTLIPLIASHPLAKDNNAFQINLVQVGLFIIPNSELITIYKSQRSGIIPAKELPNSSGVILPH